MGLIKEFKEFAVKGNIVDMAVGVIVGVAFGKVVSSLVSDIINPPLGMLIGGIDFRGLEVVLRDASHAANGAAIAAVSVKIGAFIQVLIEFLIQAFAIFLVIKAINTFNKKVESATPPPSKPSAQEVLLTEIRDILRSR